MVAVRRITPQSRTRKTFPARARVLSQFIEAHGIKRMAELGVFRGDTFFSLLDRHPDLQIVGVDTWEWGERDGDDGSRSYRVSPLHLFEADIKRDIRKYGNRAQIIKGRTVEAAKAYPDGHFDLVFIDADHTYEGVRADIEAWWPKTKFLTGHDIDMPSVKRAVADECRDYTCIGEAVWLAPC